MERLTNDYPQDNVSSALNLFYVKDRSAWVRGGGPGPEYKDISLNDYVRMISQKHNLDIAQSENDEDISCEMAELLFDGTDTVEGIIATLYTAGWAFAELRERLFAYEYAIPLERAQELAQVEKDGWPPVTPGEKTCDAHTAEAEYLLVVLWNGLHNAYGMDAKVADRVAEIAHEGDKVQPDTTPKNDPLTLEELREMDGEPVWVQSMVSGWTLVDVERGCCTNGRGETASFERYGELWLAYRRKPEEG